MLLLSFVLAIPAVGLLARSAVRGGDGEKIAFVVNLMIAWLVAAITYGYPAIIIPALIMVPVILGVLFLLTTGNTVPVPAPIQRDSDAQEG